MSELFGGSFKYLEKAMDFCSLRHNILSANIANAETPNYKAFDLTFKEQFRKVLYAPQREISLVRTNARHLSLYPQNISEIKPVLFTAPQPIPSLDGNSVDIDYQMSQLSQNGLEYQILAQTLIKKFAELRYAINDGRR